MPGATHGLADDETFGERPVIVRASGADREDLRAAAHQQNLLVADMAEQLSAIGEFGERNALRQIGAGWLCLDPAPFSSPCAGCA